MHSGTCTLWSNKRFVMIQWKTLMKCSTRDICWSVDNQCHSRHGKWIHSNHFTNMIFHVFAQSLLPVLFFILQFMVCWPSFNFLCIPCVQELHTANKQSCTFKCRKQAALYNSHTIAHWFMGYQLNSMKWLLYMISVLIAIIWKSKAVGDWNQGQSCVLVCCILMPTLPNALYFALNDTCW